MSDVIRIEFTGKDSKQWNRVFDRFHSVISQAIDFVQEDSSEATRKSTEQFVRDIGDITKGWAKAKFDSASIDNEVKLADIQKRYQEALKTKAEREGQEISNDRNRIRLSEERFASALRMLQFLHSCVATDKDGNVTLLLTNQNPALLAADLKALAESPF